MHRGSSKGASPTGGVPETLPLSASPPPLLRIVLEWHRGGRTERHEVELAAGRPIREALRAAGIAPEGVAVFRDDGPVPLDEPGVAGPYLVLSAFSGG